MYINTLLEGEDSLLWNMCRQIFTAQFLYLKFLPLSKKECAYLALSDFFQEVGVTTKIYV